METRLSILFYGKKAKMTKEGLMPIYLRVTIGGKRFETSTHRYVLPSKWSVEANRVKGNSNEARGINVFLDSLLNKVYVYHQEIINEAKPITMESFVNKWSCKKDKQVMLFEIFEQHNQKITGLIGNGYAPATLTKYRTTLEYCKQFVEFRYNQKDIGLASLDYEFISEFEFWLKSKKKCAHNTAMKYLINFKKVVLIGVKNGWIPKDPFSGYKMSRENVTRHALTEKELFTIAGRDFKNARLNQVRDIFVFCCYTGLAYVDVNKLCRRDIIEGYRGEKWLIISRQKTDSQSRIPLLPAALEILTPLCGNGMSMGMRASKILAVELITYFRKQQSIDQVTSRYLTEWNKSFHTRITAGYYLQHLFGKKNTTDLALKLLSKIPAVTGKLVSMTHGKKF